MIDTGSSKLWVFDKDCDASKDEYCKNYRKYDGSKSTKHEKIDNKFKIEYGVRSMEGYTVKDTVYLTDTIEIKKQIFGAVTKTSSKCRNYDGLLGKQFWS